MFRSWRFQLHEAEQALRDERLDDAVRQLSDGDLRASLPGQRLAAKAAGQVARRACRKLALGESDTAWQDLQLATELAGESDDVLVARRDMIHQVLRRVEQDLAAGETGQAVRRLESLENRGVATDTTRVTLQVARRLDSARNLALRGRFGDALAQVDACERLQPELPVIAAFRDQMRDQAEACRQTTEGLQTALEAENWTEVLAVADRLLEQVPESQLAQDARRRARHGMGRGTPEWKPLTAASTSQPTGDVMLAEARARRVLKDDERFALWIDGVGGYLVCLGDEVTIGQASPGNAVDVPVLADLGRVHARIRREDGYVIEPLHRVRREGKELQGPQLLSDGDEIELGDGVRMRFRQPHALSATARLEMVSRHRTQPTADGILLMADSCVLGPKWANHVVCRDWASDVVLFRRDGRLYCRASEPLEVDGKYCDTQALVEPCSQIVGSDFSMCLEQIA